MKQHGSDRTRVDRIRMAFLSFPGRGWTVVVLWRRQVAKGQLAQHVLT